MYADILKNAIADIRNNTDENYKLFSEKLANSKYELLGVRIPVIRSIARKYMKRLNNSFELKMFISAFQQYLIGKSKIYFEELMLYGIILGTSKIEDKDKIEYIKVFVHYIGDWSVCDSFCTSLKINSKQQFFEYIKTLSSSDEEFVLRFMIVVFMIHYMEDEYIDEVIAIIRSVHVDYYYTNMAIAWWMSYLYMYDKNRFFEILNKRQFNSFVLRMSVRKVIESKRVSNEEKEQLRLLRKIERY